MTFLGENVTGDYAAYNAAAMQPGNGHFVFMAVKSRASTVESFLEAHADKGIVFVASESHVDVEFWIAAPQKMLRALEKALHGWAYNAGEPIPEPRSEPQQRGIFHSIIGMPY